MGCPGPTYRVEARIIKATGQIETCGEKIGLDDMSCATITKFIAAAPKVKRSVDDETTEAIIAVREALQSWNPALYATIDFKDAPAPNPAKRQLAALADQLQLCSALINLGVTALVMQFKIDLPVDLTTLLGPCGLLCNYALCAANIICPDQATPLVTFVNAQRTSGAAGKVCEPLICASFAKGYSFCVPFSVFK